MNIRSSYWIVFWLLIFLNNCGPNLHFEYISFGDSDYPKTLKTQIIVYEDRLKIDSKFEEIGVIILDTIYPETIMEDIKDAASKYGANGIIIEGKNAVLLIVEKPSAEMEEDENSI